MAPMRPGLLFALALVACPWLAHAAFFADRPNELSFSATPARFVRLGILKSSGGEPCLDELEVYASADSPNLALATAGAKATASSLLPGYPIHQVAHLNDGRYGNSHSWIAASPRHEWVQIELPQPHEVARVVFSRDREGKFGDRVPSAVEIRVSLDGAHWQTVAVERDVATLPEGPLTEDVLLRYAFGCEDSSFQTIDRTEPILRVLRLFEEMLVRFEQRGLDVRRERAEWTDLSQRAQQASGSNTDRKARQELALQAHLAKRRLLLRDPDLAPLQRILFVRRQAYEPSHNYSDIFDPQGEPGGGIAVLEIPRSGGSLEPGQAQVRTLFDAGQGVARDVALSFDAQTIWFGYRPTKQDYYHLWRMKADGTDARPITDGPFYDYYPCPLPDGGVAFISTRCKARFLCWRPQAFVMFRMEKDGSGIRPLSFANLSEWAPTVANDGRILWTRSEYVDKGANFGHTLWAIRPDGTQPELIFGNDTDHCYVNGREVPGTSEIVCTLISHGGDLNGPIGLIEPRLGRFNAQAVRSITPDIPPQYDMNWLRARCFRDPTPVSRDYFLCSHAPADLFGLYVIDRWGNRELLHLDPAMGSMAPVLLRPTDCPPILSQPTFATTPAHPAPPPAADGQFFVMDVYQGLAPTVARGSVKFLRVCQEMRADLIQLGNGEYQQDHEPFMDWYATPVHKVSGPHGWPSYVAKGDLGLVPVEADGSASFHAPAGKVLYFEALDENYNEVQRMRSVVQLQPGERRGCIGCHEDRSQAAGKSHGSPLAMSRPPSAIEPPPWGAGAFSYEKVVQPVWDAQCVRCHDAHDKKRLNFVGTPDAEGVPASYRTLIEQGWVHYFDWGYAQRHRKAEPLSFGTVKSRLWQVLDAGHYDVKLTRDEMRRVKTWIDLNCPLWPDYQNRPQRPGVVATHSVTQP